MDNNSNQGADNRPRYFDHNSQQNGDDQQGMRPKLDAFQNIKHNPPQPPIGHQRHLQRIPQRTASHSVSYSDTSNLDTMKRRYSIENVVLTNLPNYASDQQQQQQYLSSALLSPPLTSPFSTDSLLSFFPQHQQLSQVSQIRPAQYYSNQEQSFLFSSSSASSSPSSSSSPPEATMRLIRKQQQQQQQQSQHLLHPVIESRSQSPMFDDGGGGVSRSYTNASTALNESDLLQQQQQQNQQQRNQLFDTAAEFERILLEQRINSLLNIAPQNGQMQFGEIGSSYNKQFGNHLGYNHAKSRMRAVSTGSTDIIETLMAAAAAAAAVKSNPRSVQQQPIGTHFNNGSIKSRSAATSISSMFDNTTTTTTTAAGSPSTSALLSPLMISPNNQFNQPLLSPPKMVQVQLTEEEEKLAQSGSIFERRTDWSSLLSRLPISKQNAIHLRIEDEGPYGNDETRLFLLSHFSALRLKEIPCVMCSCVLVIYDRFPIVDGTLFTSPVMYDKEKSISGGGQYKGQYIHAICLKCLLGEENHEIKCRFCQNQLNPDHIQIGTLYKFDLFAAFACCQSRLTCKACMQPIHVDEDSMSFSSYSDERQCPKCKKRTHHFIKPLNDIFLPSKCTSSCSKSHQMTPHLETIADF